MNAKKLVIFSSGALLREKMGSFKDILVHFGKEKEVKELDKEYQRRKEQGPWGMEQVAALYKGLSEAELREEANRHCREDLAEGAREVVNGLKEKGYLVGAITASPQFVMDALKDALNLDFAAGTELQFENGVATGDISKKVDRFGKAEFVKEKMQELGLEKEDVVIIGDAVSDLPMAELGKFIALNADKDSVKEKAQVVVEGNLEKVLEHI
ncbi:MAG: HAD family hydrolase [Patescibacteria group bacterium]